MIIYQLELIYNDPVVYTLNWCATVEPMEAVYIINVYVQYRICYSGSCLEDKVERNAYCKLKTTQSHL